MKILGLALAAVLAAVLAGACSPGTTPASTSRTATPVAASPPPSVAPSPIVVAPTATPPTPDSSSLGAFACSDGAGGTPTSAGMTDVRVDSHTEVAPTFDRVVFQFNGAVPSYTLTRQSSADFTKSPSGLNTKLDGTAGVKIVFHPASQSTTYTGPTDIKHPTFKAVREAAVLEDFEGYVSWGLGLATPACLRTFLLAEPNRLVIDFQTS